MGKPKNREPLTISGLIVAVLTPFTNNNTVDRKALARHLSFLHHHAVTNILINGTTGEFFSLTHEEKRQCIKIARKHFPDTIILQAGCDSLEESIAIAQYGEEVGVDAIAALPPYYLSDVQKQGIINYFNCFADSVSIPFILYNFPRHTQISINNDILSSVMHYGLKDSSATVSLANHTDHYYVGSDKNIIKAYKAGGCGFISARANLFPEIYLFLSRTLAEGNYAKAKAIHKEICAIADLYSGPNQIAMIKYALAKRLQKYPTHVRLPLMPITTEEIEKIGQGFYR